jgi:uncharacterized OB-fold protein
VGTIYSTCVIRRSPADGGDYNVTLVDLDEGPRILSTITRTLAPAIGASVRAEFEVAPDQTRLVFNLIEDTTHHGPQA